jgi:CelD/BcsL family acetyltransferase involved in cellulose biosynthesis
MPLVRRRHKGLRMIEFADLQVSDYAVPVGDPAAFRALAGDPQVQSRIRDLLKPYDLVRIKKVPDGAPPIEGMLPASRRTRMAISAHAATLRAPFSDWQAGAMSSSYVKELARKRRRLNRRGAATFELVQEPALIEEAFGHLRGWRAERFSGDLLQQDLYYAFYTQVAQAGAASGFSRTLRLALDGRTIGVVWGVSSQGVSVMLMGGFDFETYKGCSIGALAFEDLARDCIDRGDQVLDFSIGDEAYKARFGCLPSPLWMISASGTPLGRIANSVAPHIARWSAKAERQSLEPAAPD